MNLEQVLALVLRFANTIAMLAPEVQRGLALIKTMQDEDRPATAQEWATLNLAFKAALDANDVALANQATRAKTGVEVTDDFDK